MAAQTEQSPLDIEKVIKDVLATIEREREREIVSRRFGLFDRKETLEQIGELLGITRERVRQLEKAVMIRMKAAAEKDLPHIKQVQQLFVENLMEAGKVARISDLAAQVTPENSRVDQARVSFLAQLSPKLTVIDDNDNFYHAAGLANGQGEKGIKDGVAKIIEAIKKIGEPVAIENVAEAVKDTDTKHVEALASISKEVATLNGRWGLVKWPMVNPKNIRDKIYVILHESGKPMHFNEIAKTIKDSTFRRKDVTTQAIHNELIKDKRFVLIGRGIYALKEWGYDKGTVADVIAKVLKKANEPLHRDEIVKRVLKSRQVKETTILLNLQGKPQFKRVAKATYTLAE
ncbi:MAG TPA: sigma factor-like helix-turn-helix DNA-binding protein [Candidatus Saccharimonadales bacterium]|nr:sigma factor-like helix-turn-helix DNA-binding protein [Candidatus Saccharimonadales bacterium]